VKSGLAEVNGQELYYEVYGKGEPLVLIQGLGVESSGWAMQIPAFTEQFRVIAFDNRDVGRSSRAAGAYDVADMADDVAGLMGVLKVERAHVVGVSMGGLIAQELVLRHPQKVDRLVLGCTFGKISTSIAFNLRVWNWIKQRDSENEIFPLAGMPWTVSRELLGNVSGVNQMLLEMRSQPFPQSEDAYSRQVAATSRFNAKDRLGAVKAATLVLVGEQDIITPPWMGRELAEAIPGAVLQVLEGKGSAHAFMWEMSEAFNGAVLDFLTAQQMQKSLPN
jgi:3-oxoadipate enol-lactonase